MVVRFKCNHFPKKMHSTDSRYFRTLWSLLKTDFIHHFVAVATYNESTDTLLVVFHIFMFEFSSEIISSPFV